MIEDADAVPRNTEITTDVAVIGGGAAGISLALALRGRGREVLVLESGRDSAMTTVSPVLYSLFSSCASSLVVRRTYLP